MSATNVQEPAVASSGTRIEEADIAVAEKLGQYESHPAVRGAGALSEIADQAPLFVLCGTVLTIGMISGRPKAFSAGLRMVASVAVATAVKSSIKKLVSRSRPHVVLHSGRYELGPLGPSGGDWHSFPSGHTAGAVSAARGLTRVIPQARGVAYFGAAAIAAVQVPRAKHYPLDLAGGALIGIAAEAVVNRSFAYLTSRLSPSRVRDGGDLAQTRR